MPTIKTADAVVIGGGARGCSIALFLARAGVRVILVERRYLSFMVSSANGAQVNVSAKKPQHPINECKLEDFERKAEVPNISILVNTKLPKARTSREMLEEYFT